MAQRYIYLSDELNARLKKEANASALICSLLNQHYNLKDAETEATEEEILRKIALKEIELEAERKKQEILGNG